MAVEATELYYRSVERESLRRELCLTEADPALIAVEDAVTVQQTHFDAVELGRLQVPEFDRAQVFEVQSLVHGPSAAHRQLLRGLRHLTLAIVKGGLEHAQAVIATGHFVELHKAMDIEGGAA